MAGDKRADVVIAGGGFAGLALALALRQGLGNLFRVVVADPTFAADARPDPRASAIAAGARRMFEALGVWGAGAGGLRDHWVELGSLGNGDAGRARAPPQWRRRGALSPGRAVCDAPAERQPLVPGVDRNRCRGRAHHRAAR